MASSDVSGVTKYFSKANEGFSTTLSSTISAGASSVGLNSTSGLTTGDVFVGIIEPAATAQQVFTGTVDVSGSQITNVVWVRGTNVGHAGGVTIVDYVTGASHNMMTTGILKQHTQAGAHTGLTTDTIIVTSGSTLPAGDIGTADIADSAITTAKIADATIAATNISASAITLGYAQTTTSQATNSTTQVQVTGLTVNVTIPPGGRHIKITAGMFGYNANVNDGYIFDIWDGPVNTGTQLQAAGMEKNSNPNATSCIAIAVVQPAAGPKTYNVGFRSSLGGTANTNAVAGEPAYLLVEAI